MMVFVAVAAMTMILTLDLKSAPRDGPFGVHPNSIHLLVKALDELPRGNELGLQSCGFVSRSLAACAAFVVVI